jgi:hypothetical protein
MNEIAPGLHRWTARHPDWHPGGFGAEVASYALVDGKTLVLIDPLLLPDREALLDDLARHASDTYIFITIGYHVRSAAALAQRYDATIHGPAQAGKRLGPTKAFTLLEPGTPGPAGVTAHTIGKPRRGETPLHFPSHDALAFGDALVTTPEGDLRMWCQEPVTAARAGFYRDRFAPTLEPLAALQPRHVLPTHGAPHLDHGARALTTAIASPPWYHHG